MRSTVTAITYRIPSISRAGEVHTIEQDVVDGRLRCDCPARTQCWAQKAVIAGIAPKPRVRLSIRRERPQARPAATFSVDDLYPPRTAA